ncbi:MULTISPECIES: TadE/TadG family type IV pilus assembly protein [unclassified Mesorhizobium]|uniref:TadE/TadG family type IV pilus assembly protein n=1 Tax=unclassified Mesorhizobium TaxID=325217 RepID=UPI001CCDF8B1|nr:MULTISPECIES: TadE/TadG family type IV pilus assembly protein [unclassified Mesorhizobium]MBZ9738775.1 pilus assembly protein [Mesorhizobium sp. CO1-1-4]MBZ9802923.1 pilus assembly protein [Mesorhizobium sp. ES1-6]
MSRNVGRHLTKFRRDQRGAVLVEMTIVAPLMLLLSAGVFEFGNLIHDKLLMEAGLTDAARFGARCNSQLYTDYASSGFSAIDCTNVAKNIAVYGTAAPTVVNGVVTTNPRVSGWQTANVTVTIGASGSCHDAVVAGVTQYRSVTPQVCIVSATGTYPYSGVGMLAFLNIGPITLSGSHQERLIRF